MGEEREIRVAMDGRTTKHADPPLPTPVREVAHSPAAYRDWVAGMFLGVARRQLLGFRYYLVHDEQSGAIEEVSQARYNEVVAQHKAYDANLNGMPQQPLTAIGGRPSNIRLEEPK